MGQKTKTNNTTISIDVANTTTEEEKKTFNWWKFGTIVFLILAFFGSGFYFGKKSVDPSNLPPVYTPGDTVYVDKPYPEPVYVTKPADTLNIIANCVKNGKYSELFPERVIVDTLYKPTSQDTLDIVKDWATQRTYKEKIFDVDTLGTATMTATVQYNRISNISAEVVPVVKNVPYVVPPKKFSPFVGAGLTTASSVYVNGGFFVNDKWGGNVFFLAGLNGEKNAVGAGAIYKF